MPNARITPTIHYALCAVMGGCIGFFTAFIFWAIYFFQTFDLTIPDSIRFRAALWDTAFILLAIVIVYHLAFILLEVVTGTIAPFPWREWVATLTPEMEEGDEE
jgi:succinate dehydrogenase hydrophobic anchor subunit